MCCKKEPGLDRPGIAALRGVNLGEFLACQDFGNPALVQMELSGNFMLSKISVAGEPLDLCSDLLSKGRADTTAHVSDPGLRRFYWDRQERILVLAQGWAEGAYPARR